jgi:predicted DNA-binding transcriptional regulator YafY
MPVNRNALIRFRTIDTCLRNRYRRWTLEDLLDACSEALYEYEGIDKGISRRTIQMDIQLMRSDKLGYNAPIVVLEKKYYTYEDPDYSITNSPITDQDLGRLTEAVEILRQFKGFSHFHDLGGMVQRLENKIRSAKTNQAPVIDFEKNDNLKGLEHIDTLYQAIINKRAVDLTYQSFKAREASVFHFHAYYLKEYRNRWFVLGVRKKGEPLLNLALDRIISIADCKLTYVAPGSFNLHEHFRHVIGVSVSPGVETERVLLKFDRQTLPYVQTKPLHHSQEIVESPTGEPLVSLQVQLNFELERELLGYGDRVQVLEPARLKRRIRDILNNALDSYIYEFNTKSLQNNLQRFIHRGSTTLHHIYRRKEVDKIRNTIYLYLKAAGENADTYAIRHVLKEIPALKQMLFTPNLLEVLRKINPGLFLTKAIFFDKSPEANWYVTWHQDTTINVAEKIATEGFTGWTRKNDVHGVNPPEDILKDTVTIRIHLDDTDETNGALQILPGSHNKKLSDDEIKFLTQNTVPHHCDVPAGGVHVMRPLLLHASSKATQGRHRRVIHLEFNSTTLPNGLTWAEKYDLWKNV